MSIAQSKYICSVICPMFGHAKPPAGPLPAGGFKEAATTFTLSRRPHFGKLRKKPTDSVCLWRAEWLGKLNLITLHMSPLSRKSGPRETANNCSADRLLGIDLVGMDLPGIDLVGAIFAVNRLREARQAKSQQIVPRQTKSQQADGPLAPRSRIPAKPAVRVGSDTRAVGAGDKGGAAVGGPVRL